MARVVISYIDGGIQLIIIEEIYQIKNYMPHMELIG